MVSVQLKERIQASLVVTGYTRLCLRLQEAIRGAEEGVEGFGLLRGAVAGAHADLAQLLLHHRGRGRGNGLLLFPF